MHFKNMSQIDLVRFETNVFSDFYVFLGYFRGSQFFHAQGLRCSCKYIHIPVHHALGREGFLYHAHHPSCRSVLPKTGGHQIRSRKKSKSCSCRVFESHFGSLSPFAGMRLRHVRLPEESLSANSLIHALLGDQSICSPRYPRCDIGLVSSG